jgi:hypothetical protein
MLIRIFAAKGDLAASEIQLWSGPMEPEATNKTTFASH